MKRQKIIAAVIIAFAMLVLCGCGDLVVEKNASKTAEIGKLTVDIPEGYRTYEEYQKLTDKYGDFFTEDDFDRWLEPIYGVKPEYKYFANVDLGTLSTNWFSEEYSEDEIWEGQKEYEELQQPDELSYEELDIEGLEDVRLGSYIANHTVSHMEGDKKVFDEGDVAFAAFTYEGQVYLFELFESSTQVQATTLKETRQRMVDMLESIGTHLAEE